MRSSNGTEDRESWISFVESDLAVENSKLNVQLGGGRPDVNGLDPQTGPSVLGPSRADLDADDEDEFDGYEAFIVFRCLPGVKFRCVRVDTGNAGAKVPDRIVHVCCVPVSEPSISTEQTFLMISTPLKTTANLRQRQFGWRG